MLANEFLDIHKEWRASWGWFFTKVYRIGRCKFSLLFLYKSTVSVHKLHLNRTKRPQIFVHWIVNVSFVMFCAFLNKSKQTHRWLSFNNLMITIKMNTSVLHRIVREMTHIFIRSKSNLKRRKISFVGKNILLVLVLVGIKIKYQMGFDLKTDTEFEFKIQSGFMQFLALRSKE
ncbi:hypothetical protein EGR_09315 [Echinococcus granulosus]|uniref:Uncharacterized protein n=1 Tax=Echinococcus granulosus TaxID=6210 RepID=W6U5J0_ECHGR|nr:hypothetical protein EGR_09315 [Echinococcus granulosus]EUB55841.1 hypothetical protein EGR_09315 [Echinococcus granulosus]